MSLSVIRLHTGLAWKSRGAMGTCRWERWPVLASRSSPLKADRTRPGTLNRSALAQLLVPELVLAADRNLRLSYVSSTLIRDTRDKPLDAHTGEYQTLDLRIVPSAFGSSADFVRLLSQYAYYKPWHRMVFANS